MSTSPRRVLALNGGSSSIKFAVFEGDPLRRAFGGKAERAAPDAVAGVLDDLQSRGALDGLAAVGHRVVHGGPDRFDPELVTSELLADLRTAVPLDPDHLPAEIRLIEAVASRLPSVPQVVCFDTAFHRDLPAVARTLPLPPRPGLRRYGFHGLSYEYLLSELARVAGAEAAHGRVILAHLGSGASMAAVKGGTCIDTTMGFTPTGGLLMGTRSGDLDPGVLVHLLRSENLSADQLDDFVNRQAGLKGVSGTSSDVRELLAKRESDPRAALAVELFCYTARKSVGALTAALGGLDTLVFSGGIGEHAPEVRAGVCEGLSFLGVSLDPDANAGNAPVISANGARVAVRVIPTDEEVVIARTTLRLIGGPT
jgi:acetate kinase